ncbi:MAG: hypothetical protein DYG89_15210 [Caldilinea sp. CFX5]|nr:hypothetical protein [Caldilinea sp. CFX5]
MLPVLVTGPTEEPVTLAEAKAHCRVEHTDDDAYITAVITTARVYVEQRCWISLCTQTWRQYLDGWPGDCRALTYPPVTAISNVTYRDYGGNTLTLAAGVYTLTPDNLCFCLAANQAWPTVALWPQWPIAITYTAGWAAAAVPTPLKQAMLLLIGHWYENREAVVVSAGVTVSSGAVQMAVDSLLYLYEVR